MPKSINKNKKNDFEGKIILKDANIELLVLTEYL